MKKILVITLLLALAFVTVSAQSRGEGHSFSKDGARWSITTNVVDWGWFFTPNISIGVGVAQHVSLEANAKINSWTYNKNSETKRNRQACQEYRLSCLWWPWYVHSGWYLGGGIQYSEYSRRLFTNPSRKEEADAAGASISAGYAIQVTPHINVTVGLGVWTGIKLYKLYEDAGQACPECGRRVDGSGFSDDPSKAFFFLPNEVKIGLSFVF